MGSGMVWLTIGLLVLFAIAMVVAAFWDRRRARRIERDLADQSRRHRSRPP